jgi:hypothetical protein
MPAVTSGGPGISKDLGAIYQTHVYAILDSEWNVGREAPMQSQVIRQRDKYGGVRRALVVSTLAVCVVVGLASPAKAIRFTYAANAWGE